MVFLKQSTAATVKLGPFLDDTDGKTAETALSIAQADIRLSKNGGSFGQTNNATGATHDEAGEYGIPLDTTDTNTLGVLKVRVSKTGALPVWQEFMVIPANVFDSLVSGSDKLDVNTAEIAGATTGLNGLNGTGAYYDANGYLPAIVTDKTGFSLASNAITASVIATDAITAAKIATDAVTEIQTGLATASSISTLTGYVDTEVAAIKAKTDLIPASPAATGDVPTAGDVADAVWDELKSGHAVSGSFGSYLDAAVSGVSTGGVSAGDIADAVWDEAQSGHTTSGTFGKYLDAQVSTAGGGSLTAGSIADAVWDEAISGHATAGSTGAKLTAASAAGDPWATELPGSYVAGTAGAVLYGTNARVSGGQITVVSGVDDDGNATIIQGDDYPSGQLIINVPWSGESITGATATLIVQPAADYTAGQTTNRSSIGTVSIGSYDSGTGTYPVTVVLSDTATAALSGSPTDGQKDYRYQIRAVVGSNTHSFVGWLSVVRQIGVPS